MSAFAYFPKDDELASGSAGACVVRLGGENEPVTPRERELALAVPATHGLFRAVVWTGGAAFLGCYVAAEPPAFAKLITDLAEFPLEWCEIARTKQS